jgi:hypothetical protein
MQKHKSEGLRFDACGGFTVVKSTPLYIHLLRLAAVAGVVALAVYALFTITGTEAQLLEAGLIS